VTRGRLTSDLGGDCIPRMTAAAIAAAVAATTVMFVVSVCLLQLHVVGGERVIATCCLWHPYVVCRLNSTVVCCQLPAVIVPGGLYAICQAWMAAPSTHPLHACHPKGNKHSSQELVDLRAAWAGCWAPAGFHLHFCMASCMLHPYAYPYWR